jgi:hypothetical protein
MDGINPIYLLWILDWIDIRDVDDDGLIVGADEYTFENIIGVGVDFLMRHIRRHKDEIAWTGFRDEFEAVPPAHACLASDDKDHALKCTMMVDARLGVRLDCDRSGPDFLRADAGVINSRLPKHARGLGCVGIELVALDDADAVMLPALLMRMRVVMGVIVVVVMVCQGMDSDSGVEGQAAVRSLISRTTSMIAPGSVRTSQSGLTSANWTMPF